MAFHRLTANPIGYDPFPGGYDFINDPAANGNAGVPANADGKKVGGPNDGTYFVGFGEDATSADANRGFKALAQNTDELDNYMRRPLAVPARTANVTAVAPVSSILLPDASGVFVAGASSAIPETLQTLFEILDDSDNEIIDPSTGTKCVVTAITGVPPVSIGDGFSSGTVTLTVSPSIPTGKVYRVYYAKKSNLRDMPVDTFTVIKIRGAQELPAGFEDFQKMISRYTATNVTALVATLIETPDGVRLPKSNAMGFDLDADGTVGGIHRLFVRKLRDGVPVTMFEVNDDTSLGGAAVGRARLASGYVLEAVGAMLLRDSNIASGAAQGGAFISLTGSTTANGDKYIRLLEKGPLVGGTTRSVFQTVNGRWACTVGDGTESFGDFNGVDAVQQALAYWQAIGAPTGGLYVQVKTGSYTVTDGNGPINIVDSTHVVLEGPGLDFCTLTLSRTLTSSLTVETNGVLTIRGITVTRSGTFNPSVLLNGNIEVENSAFVNAQVKSRNQGAYGGDPSLDYTFVMRRVSFQSIGLGVPPVLINRNSATVSDQIDYLFEDCRFHVNETNTPAVRLEADAASGNNALINSVRFVRTNFFLGSSTISGNNPVGRSCPLDFVDNGSIWGTGSGGVLVRDVAFEDCNVWAGAEKSTDATVQLFHFHAPGLVLKKLTIRGGRWMVMKDDPSLAPFVIAGSGMMSTAGAPEEVDISDVVMGWATAGDFSGSGRSTATTYGRLYAYLTPPAAVADHAAFYINAGKVRLHGVRVVGMCHYSAEPELWVDGAVEIDVDKVVLETGAVGVAGTAPNFRVKMTPSANNLGTSANGVRSVRRVSIDGSRIDAGSLQGALTVLPFGYLEVADCFIASTAGGAANSGGVTMPLVDPQYGNASFAMLEGLKVRRNRLVGNAAHGFCIHHDGAVGRSAAIGRLEVSGNVSSLNGGRGFHIECAAGATVTCTFPEMLFSGNTANLNTGRAFAIFPSAFIGTGGRPPTIVHNTATCSGNADAPAVGTLQNAGDQIRLTLQGNTVENTVGGSGILGIRALNGVVFPADESVNGTFIQCVGVESGWVLVTGSIYRAFNGTGGGNIMTQNNACSLRLT